MKVLYFIIAIILCTSGGYAQRHVSGYVFDSETKETIIGASIIDTAEFKGTSTNSQGYFSLKTQTSVLKVSSIGYKDTLINLDIIKSDVLSIYLHEYVQVLQQVDVSAQPQNNLNISKLNIKEIRELPALGGQPDVIKATSILPGVQTQNELSSMLVIRGGDPGQNMYLLDGTELLSVNHLGGIMSVFNPDIIKDIQIYKGGFPAKFGGKLSSIIDITQRDGNSSELKGTFGIGVTDINLSLEGKIGEKTTFIFNGRKTLFDILLYGFTSVMDDYSSKIYYGFYDTSMKVSWNANNKNKFFFNVFQGDDYIHTRNKNDKYNTIINSKNHRGNVMLSGAWNSIINSKLFGRTLLSYTRYRVKDFMLYKNDINTGYEKALKSGVDNYSLNSNWKYRAFNWWRIDAGLHVSYGYYTPYNYKITGDDSKHEVISNSIIKNALSLSSKLNLSDFIILNIGVRASNYFYSDEKELSIEPRLDMTFKTKRYGNISMNYMYVSQDSHLFLSPGNVYTNETWLPASKEIPVSKSKQYSVAWNKNFYDNMFMLSFGVYQKNMLNLITAKNVYFDAKSIEKWENILEKNGKGVVRGIELLLKKNYGNWTGILSYHLSNSTRNFENINNGNEYVYEYNRPNDLSIFVSRDLNKKWSFSLTWHYRSGLPYTPVIGRQTIINPNLNGVDYDVAFIYGKRNSERMKDYHRMDIGLKYKTVTKNRKLPCEWTFSVFNLYNRQNASYYYYSNNNGPYILDNNTHFDMYQMSILPVIPSISYKVFFRKEDLKSKFENLSLKNWLYYEN